MDKDTKTTLEQFTKKAIQRLKDKKIPKTATLHIPSMDEDIVIRSLTDEEVVECTNIEDDNDQTVPTNMLSIWQPKHQI